MTTRAVLFDLDGTLVDNMRLHVEAWMNLCARNGWVATEDVFHAFAGKKNEEILPLIAKRSFTKDELDALAEEKEAEYRELFRPKLALTAGADALLTRLRTAGIKVAIASAAPAPNRQFVLDGLALHPRFDAVVGAEAVTRGKPFPDLFLAAAERVGVPAADCVVFEDAVNGVAAGRAAGMPVVGVTTVAKPQALLDAGAFVTIPDFENLPKAVEALLFGAA